MNMQDSMHRQDSMHNMQDLMHNMQDSMHMQDSIHNMQDSISDFPGFGEMEPMEQFMEKVKRCGSCTNDCYRGMVNFQCSNVLRKWFPQMCSYFNGNNNVKYTQG